MICLLSAAAILIAACNPVDVISASHVLSNAPKQQDFHQLLKRDLTAALCPALEVECAIDYEMLREGATQVGIAYPKYYVWTTRRASDGQDEQGAVRLAAIDRVRFEVTNYIAASHILADPSSVDAVFPKALVASVLNHAEHATATDKGED